MPVAEVVKSLVFVLDDQRPVMALVTGDATVDVGALARAAGAAEARLARSGEVRELTGYLPGGGVARRARDGPGDDGRSESLRTGHRVLRGRHDDDHAQDPQRRSAGAAQAPHAAHRASSLTRRRPAVIGRRRAAPARPSRMETRGRSGEHDDDGDPHAHHRLGRPSGHPLAGGPRTAGRGGARGARPDRRVDAVRARARGPRGAGRHGRRRARHDARRAGTPSGRAGAGTHDAGRPRRRAAGHRRTVSGHHRRLLRGDLRPRERREARHHRGGRRHHQPRRRRASGGRLLLAGGQRAGPAGGGARSARAVPRHRQHRQARPDGHGRRA